MILERKTMLLAASALCFCSGAAAQAQTRDPLGAQALFDSGMEQLRLGNSAEACEKFNKSLELEPAVSTIVKVAQCAEREQRLATAWYGYERALKLNREVEQPERRRKQLDAYIRARILDLKPRVPKLRLVVSHQPEHLTIYRDGTAIPLAALGEVLPIDPGVHRLRATAPGYVESSAEVELAAGQIVTQELTLETVPTKVLPPRNESFALPPTLRLMAKPRIIQPRRPAPTKSPPKGSADASQYWVGVLLGSLGIASLGVAGYFGLHTRALVDDMVRYCDPDGCEERGITLHDRALRERNLGWGLAGAGAGALVTGILLMATSGTHPSESVMRSAP